MVEGVGGEQMKGGGGGLWDILCHPPCPQGRVLGKRIKVRRNGRIVSWEDQSLARILRCRNNGSQGNSCPRYQSQGLQHRRG